MLQATCEWDKPRVTSYSRIILDPLEVWPLHHPASDDGSGTRVLCRIPSASPNDWTALTPACGDIFRVIMRFSLNMWRDPWHRGKLCFFLQTARKMSQISWYFMSIPTSVMIIPNDFILRGILTIETIHRLGYQIMMASPRAPLNAGILLTCWKKSSANPIAIKS